jgi:hypothetical protein
MVWLLVGSRNPRLSLVPHETPRGAKGFASAAWQVARFRSVTSHRCRRAEQILNRLDAAGQEPARTFITDITPAGKMLTNPKRQRGPPSLTLRVGG